MASTSYEIISSENHKLIEAFRKRNEEKEILEIMNKDERYEVLFNFFFYEVPSKQRASSIRDDYSKIRDLLEKKSYIAAMAHRYSAKGGGMTCCIARTPPDHLHPMIVT